MIHARPGPWGRARRLWVWGATAAAALAVTANFAVGSVVTGARLPGATERAAAATGPTLPGTACPSFPVDSAWNTPSTTLPVDTHSATWLASMNAAGTFLHPDYGPSGS